VVRISARVWASETSDHRHGRIWTAAAWSSFSKIAHASRINCRRSRQSWRWVLVFDCDMSTWHFGVLAWQMGTPAGVAPPPLPAAPVLTAFRESGFPVIGFDLVDDRAHTRATRRPEKPEPAADASESVRRVAGIALIPPSRRTMEEPRWTIAKTQKFE
jgi:hypothetical protein